MAKKKEETARARVLSKIIQGCTLQIGSGEGEPITFTGGEGWVDITVGAYKVIYNISTIDLSGYQIQDETLFPQGILMQDMNTLPVGVTGWAPPVMRATMVSTTPIVQDDLINGTFAASQWHLPGSINSNHNLNSILMGRSRLYLTLSTFAGLVLQNETMWGSGDSTAGDKLWLVDAYVLPTIALQNFAIPDQAFVIPSIIAKEPELEYLMRLQRSVEPVY